MRYAIIVLALLGVLASPRPAAAVDGNQLLASCGMGDAGGLACTYYVVGWRDAFAIATVAAYGLKSATEQNLKMRICIPDGVTNGQLEKVVLKYLRDNPATLHIASAYLTAAAIQEAFPCRLKRSLQDARFTRRC
jgi:hypothetical protein